MRKIENDAELLQLSEQGMTGKAIAEMMGCSPAAVSKRLSRLRKQAPPDSLTRLSEKQQKFAVALAQGKTKTQAAMESFETASRDSAKSIGCKLASDPDIHLAVTDLLAQVGLTKRRRAERLADMVESADLGIVGRGLELTYKLDRSLVEQVEHRLDEASIRLWIESVKIPEQPEIVDITPR